MSKPSEALNRFTSTYARIMISDSPALLALIVRHSGTELTPSFDPDIPSELPSILTTEQIQEVLQGPWHHFFRQKLEAYALIVRIQTELNLQKEEIFKEAAVELTDEKKIPAHLLEKLTAQEFNALQKKFDELILSHHQQWLDDSANWSQLLLQKMHAEDFNLSEFDINEFLDPDTLSKLLNRATELNIDITSFKNASINFEDYLTLKTKIAIYNALSRQHKPHGENELKQEIKKLRKEFSAIRQQEKQIIEEQGRTTEELMRPIFFAKGS